MPDHERLALIFKALAHPVRIGIIAELVAGRAGAGGGQGPGVIELAERVEISRFAASFHLEQLREAGIVEKHRIGTRWAHRLTEEAFDAVDDWLGAVLPAPAPLAAVAS
ncbi:ArsR/SmtB family transcription factor [Microbacterium sp. CJ88]|uniref:ArsR/SmtB family transcription factor n=1 Tax=Microbacterium sp. CJ88 TaxID=3445672 RepID=UPI003F65850D